MRINKIFWSILLAVVLFCTTVSSISPFAATVEDVAGTKYEKAVSVLYNLGIVEGRENGEFDAPGNVTRAEMVAMIVRMMGIEDWAEERDCFADVPYEHWAYYYVTTAYSLGIIHGVSETEFMPDAPVTGEQAIKMVINLLGYTVKAEAAGGYPAGYVSCAVQLGILNGVDEIGGGELCRGDMSMLLYNALDTEMLKPTSYGDDSYTFEEDALRTPLSYYLHIKLMEGVVTATYAQEIAAPGRSLRTDEVVLSGQTIAIGATDADKRLGEHIVAYVKEEADGSLSMLALTSKSTVETVHSHEILAETTGNTFCFERDAKTERISIQGAQVIVNGEPRTPSAAALQPETGSVKLISKGGSVEYVIVESYENYVVERVASSRMTVAVLENRTPERSISFNNTIPTVFTLSDGTAADISACKEWDVLSLAESANGKYRKVVLTSNIVTGTLSEISVDSVTIGETEYPVAKSLIEIPDFEMPRLGTEAAFSLDMFGHVAAVNTDTAATAYYAWLLNAAMTKGLDSRPQLRLFTHEGKVEVLDCMDKVTLNGHDGDAAEILADTSPLKSGGVILEQLIKYEKNGEKISSVETATDYRHNFNSPNRVEDFSLDAYIKPGYKLDNGTDEYTIFIGGNMKAFGRNWLVRSETVIFVLPGSGEEKDYYTKSWDSMKHGTDGTEIYDDIALYDIGEDEVVSVLVWDRRDERDVTEYMISGTKLALVESVSTALDESTGGSISKLVLRPEGGGSLTVTADNDFEVLFGEAATDRSKDPVCVGGVRPARIGIQDIEPGDVIYYVVDSNNWAVQLCVLFRGHYPANYEKDSLLGTIKPTTVLKNYSDRLMSYGEVCDFTKYGFMANVNLYDAQLDKASDISVKSTMYYTNLIYLFDKQKNSVEAISKEDVEIGDKILFMARTYTPLMTIVYR